MNVNNGTYSGMTGATLRTAAPGIGANVKGVSLNTNAGYCVEDTEGNGAWQLRRRHAGAARQAGYARPRSARHLPAADGTAAS